jgi:hypothetical protein
MNSIMREFMDSCFHEKLPPLRSAGILVERLVKKLVEKLVDEKNGQKLSKIRIDGKPVLPSCVGRFAKLCREICQAM